MPKENSKEFDKYIKVNQANWDSRVAIHQKTEYYDLQNFKSNPNQLSFQANEHIEIGDVSGKTLLHLQCHFGLDTLSFARLGAKVLGVDFSSKAINTAKSIRDELGLPAEFIQSNIYDLPSKLQRTFDIVFTSIGVLCWLPDVFEWAKIIAHYLKPNGLFYIKDGHPFRTIFAGPTSDEKLYVEYPYFNSKPYRYDEGYTYGSTKQIKENPVSFEWQHTLSRIINALIGAGLQITEFKEYPYGHEQYFPCMIKNDERQWGFPDKTGNLIPCLFSIKATKKKLTDPTFSNNDFTVKEE